MEPAPARPRHGAIDHDEWFPASIEPATARHEAAAAIAVCTMCLVRAQCLEPSLRHWEIGQHGIWGGLVPADRARLRRLLATGHGGAAGLSLPGARARLPYHASLARQGWTSRER